VDISRLCARSYDLSASFFTQAMTTIGGDRYLDEATAPLVANVTYGSARWWSLPV